MTDPSEILTLTSEAEKLEAQMLAAPHIGEGDARSQIAVRLADVKGRLWEATRPAPPAVDAPDVVAGRVRSRMERSAIDARLRQELAAAPEGSRQAEAILSEIIALGAADVAAAPESDTGFTWGHYEMSNDSLGTPGAVAARVRLTSEVAGWQPDEAVRLLASLADLAGKDPATMEALPDLSAVDGHHLARAVRALPESEVNRLRDAGWFRSLPVRETLVAIGKRRA